jgi:hypothetical protein
MEFANPNKKDSLGSQSKFKCWIRIQVLCRNLNLSNCTESQPEHLKDKKKHVTGILVANLFPCRTVYTIHTGTGKMYKSIERHFLK